MPTADNTLVVALETSGSCGSVALVDRLGSIGECSLQSGKTHSRRLLAMVERIMDECEVQWPQIAGVAVGLGPGSFTGLRIGLSCAKGLALATGKPLVGISSLDGLAVQLAGWKLPICPMIDARKKEVFAAFYHPASMQLSMMPQEVESMISRAPGRHGPYLALPPEELAGLITTPTLLLGSGAQLYRELFLAELGELALFAPPQLFFSRASAIGLLARERLLKGERHDPAGLTPIYVRDSDAKLSQTGRQRAAKGVK